MDPAGKVVCSEQSGKPKRTAILWTVYGVLGVGLLAWPVLSVLTVFLWDDSARSLHKAYFKLFLASSIWLYPVLWGIGLFLSLRARRRGESLWEILWPALIPVSSPGVWIFLVIFFPNTSLN